MATLTELFQKVLNLDPKKDYDFTVTEQNITPSAPDTVVPPVPPVEPPVPTTQPPTPTTPPISTVENKANDIASMQAQIQSLQAANLALLNRIPVEANEKSTEDLIFELCVPKSAQGKE